MMHIMGEILTLFIMAFALGMDAFSIGLGMGMYKLRLRQVMLIGLTVGAFHVVMPLFGMMAGSFLSERLGAIAGYAGGGLLVVLGIQMIFSSFQEEDSLVTPAGFGVIVFALSVSLDSFSVGLTLGIYGAKTVLTILMFGGVATVLTWAGLLVGKKIGSWLGSYSEALGGLILLFLGIQLIWPF
ncbi:membrane protein [Bacillus coahuilensis m2-6]|uniref:manganese efflux pump MntP n=1 Tax=Bacillus coahuilensis TaxID=408580 RepID=UPI00018513AD|nr:manganese efflux pump [Bacillus coahuilensis]KUP05068.1 membrane protein [Bacillus coahuilensis m2-6]